MTSPSRARSLWTIWAPLPLLLLLLLDWTFPYYFWRIPKITGRSADYGYQFLVDLQEMARRKPDGAQRVLAFGSSVAGSFDPAQVQTLLEARLPDLRVDVRRLVKPSMKPSDYRLFLDTELDRIRPDVALLMFNLQDFLNSSFERDVKPDVQYVLPPWPTLCARYRFLSVSESLELLLAELSNFYRYRRPLRSSIEDHARALASWVRSPGGHGGYGVYADGYTRRRFAIPVRPGAPLDLEYYIDPAWIAQRGKITLEFRAGRSVLATQVETTPGWKSLHLPVPAGAGSLLQVASDSTWTARAAGVGDDLRLLGVRLRHAPAGVAGDGKPPFHYPPLDDRDVDEFLRMRGATDGAFVERWQAALAGSDEFGERMRAWRDTRLTLRNAPFEPTAEYRELAHLVDDLTGRGVSVILVNTPENPLMTEYQNGTYYRDYRSFFRTLAETHPGVSFLDLLDSLPPQDFNDLMHASYIGIAKLGPVYADAIEPVLRARAADPNALRSARR